jgi:membrane-bound lytic murein transglycosylase MltF
MLANKTNHIKTVLLLCLVSVSLLALSCRGEEERNAKKEVELPSASADLDHPLAVHHGKKYSDDLDGLLERRFIRVLTSFNKTSFFISGGKLFGFEYSLMKDYEKFLNRNIKRNDLKVVIEFIPVSLDVLMPTLTEGLGDIAAAGLTVTPERLRQVDFTDPYLTGIDEVIVTHKDVGGIEKLEDLSGRRIFVHKSTSYHESLLKLNKAFSEKGLKPVEIVPADDTLETEDILEMVNSGAVEITVSDSHIAEIWARVFEDIRVHDDLKLREGGEIAWMVRKENPRLKESLNAFIRKHRKGTLMGNIYFNRYFKNIGCIKNPLCDKVEQKIRFRLRLRLDSHKGAGLSGIGVGQQQEEPLGRSRDYAGKARNCRRQEHRH